MIVGHEAHLGHVVGLVEDGDRDVVHLDGAALDEVVEAPRRRDEDVVDRHPHRDAGAPQRPPRARRRRDGRLDRRPRRGRPHGRDGLHGRDHDEPRQDPGRRPAPALLGDARPRHRRDRREVPHRPGDALDERRNRPRSRAWTTTSCSSTPAAREGHHGQGHTVFCRTKLARTSTSRSSCASRRSSRLTLHHSLDQGQRNRVLGAFATGASRARRDGCRRPRHPRRRRLGHCRCKPQLLHRSGRTARASDDSVVTLALPHQRETMERLEDAHLEESRRSGPRPAARSSRPPAR